MRSKEVTSVDSLNQYISRGWVLVKGYENNGVVKYLIMKDDTKEKSNDKERKKYSGV